METACAWSTTNPIVSVIILLLVPPLTQRLGPPALVEVEIR